MTPSVYGPLAAFSIVKLKAGSMELIMTRGNRPTNNIATVKTMVIPDIVNAQPSFFLLANTTPRIADSTTAPSKYRRCNWTSSE